MVLCGRGARTTERMTGWKPVATNGYGHGNDGRLEARPTERAAGWKHGERQ